MENSLSPSSSRGIRRSGIIRYSRQLIGSLVLVIILSLIGLTLLPGASVDAHEDDLFIDFELTLDTAGSGSLHLYIGTAVTTSLEPSDLEAPGEIGSYDNPNLIRVMEGFGPHMEDREGLFRSILETSSDVVLHELVYMTGNVTGVFALSLDISFSFNGSGSSMEYRYLNFLKRIPLPYAQEGDRYAEMWRDREIETMRRCVVSIRFDLDRDLSLDLQNEGGDHHRTPSGESLDRQIDLGLDFKGE